MREPRWRLDLNVPASSGSLAEVRQALGTLAIPADVLEDAKVLVSELVGNSVKHAGLHVDDQVQVTAEWSGERLRVTVHDQPRPPTPPPVAAAIRPRPGAESGWGLFIVDRLASRWGTDEAGYWFELDGSRTARR
jgi:anti-sigma regulatory factor (Ser/Thr protein kinase)